MNHSVRRIGKLAQPLEARRYLEIGVARGETFLNVPLTDRTGVDPQMAPEVEPNAAGARCVHQTSDAFFADEPFFSPYDIAFIDGLHVFEQVVRDFSNVVLRTHARSVILLDDTVPNDVYSALPDQTRTNHFRAAAGLTVDSWHGDVYKMVFYIHDFWPSLNYRTIIEGGNPQTLVWRANGPARAPRFDNLETISRMSYFDMHLNADLMRPTSEDEAIELCLREIAALPAG